MSLKVLLMSHSSYPSLNTLPTQTGPAKISRQFGEDKYTTAMDLLKYVNRTYHKYTHVWMASVFNGIYDIHYYLDENGERHEFVGPIEHLLGYIPRLYKK